MSDAWDEIQAIKTKRNSLRERLEKRKKERQELLGNTTTVVSLPDAPSQSPSSASSSATGIPFSKGAIDAKEIIQNQEQLSPQQQQALPLELQQQVMRVVHRFYQS